MWSAWKGLRYKHIQDDEQQETPSELQSSRNIPWASVCLGLAVLAILEAVYIHSVELVPQTFTCSSLHEIGYSGWHQKEYTFTGHESHDWSVKAVESAWKDFDLPHDSFVHITKPSQFGLLPNKNVLLGKNNIYMMSMYHQLHCLKEIQTSMVKLSTGERMEDLSLGHMQHCFSYLKQGILCAGDLTLEGPDVVDGEVQGSLQGWNISHTCADREEMVRWIEEHAVGD